MAIDELALSLISSAENRLAHVLDCFLAYVLWKTLDNWKHAYGCGTVTRERIEDAARNANIYEDIGQIPGGFESNLTERGTNLSGCQRQRIAIARIFL